MHKFKITRWRAAVLTSSVLLLASFSAYAQNQGNAAMVPVTTTVTVLGPKNTAAPPITKQDVIVYSNKDKLNVIGWVPSQGQSQRSGLQLAILIDNAVNSTTLGSQFNDIKQFILAQGKNTAVGLFYAENGTAQQVSPFDTNHAAVAQKVRLSFGRAGGESPSIYLSLQDLAKKWPATPGRREVLLISSGIDRLNPGLADPYFDSAVDNVQKAGIVVHTIYAGGNRFGQSLRGGNSQSKLVELTENSGGQGYFEGLGTPVSFSPFLSQLDMTLRNQYQLTVLMPRSKKKKGELRPIKITTEDRTAVISAPKQVLVPGS